MKTSRFVFFCILTILLVMVKCHPKEPLVTSSPLTLTNSHQWTDLTFISPAIIPISGFREMILFVSLRGESPGIYAVTPDGSTLYRIITLPSSYQIMGHMDWTIKKNLLAFAMSSGERTDVVIADLLMASLHNITGGTQSGGTEPKWSPDGAQLAYICGDYEPDICVIDIENMNVLQLTFHPSWDINPSWSPDGSTIAYQTNRGGLSDIYAINLQTRSEVDLTKGVAQNAQPSWAPDGKHILFQSDRNGSMDIFLVNPDGSGVTNLTPFESLEVDPQWSPTGEFIAFRSNRDGEWDLFIMKKDGSDIANLTKNWGPVFTFSWSPDGRRIAFSSGQYGSSKIYSVNVDDREVSNLTPQIDAMLPLWIALTPYK